MAHVWTFRDGKIISMQQPARPVDEHEPATDGLAQFGRVLTKTVQVGSPLSPVLATWQTFMAPAAELDPNVDAEDDPNPVVPESAPATMPVHEPSA